MTTTDQPIIRPSGLPLSVPGQRQELTDWSAYGPCDTLTPIVDDLRPAPGCGAAAGAPCIVRNTTRERPHPHTGRRRLDDTATPEPGPVWTNGMAPAAVAAPGPYVRHFGQHDQCAECGMVTGARAVLAVNVVDLHFTTEPVTCPTWCTRHEHGQPTIEAHGIDLLQLTVLDDELTTDVPLRVELVQALEPGSRPYVHLSIGHQLYQPTCVVLSQSDRARLAAALLTGGALLDASR